MVKGKIAPYFRNTGLTLDGIQAKHIQSFYLHELKTVSPGTVIHYHANIHKALKCAVKMDLIPFNPADKVERPKKQRYIVDYYRQEELERLLEASKDHPYPDVMDIAQMCQILDVSTKTGYRLIREGKICCIKVGRAYRIPKAHLFTYLCIGC